MTNVKNIFDLKINVILTSISIQIMKMNRDIWFILSFDVQKNNILLRVFLDSQTKLEV